METRLPPPASVPLRRVDDRHLLPAPTATDRLAEWQGKGENLIRRYPVAALIVAAGAGLLFGRLFRGWLDRRFPRES